MCSNLFCFTYSYCVSLNVDMNCCREVGSCTSGITFGEGFILIPTGVGVKIISHSSLILACAVRLADTLCPRHNRVMSHHFFADSCIICEIY